MLRTSNLQKSDAHEFQTHAWSSQTPYDGYNHPATGHVELGSLQGYL